MTEQEIDEADYRRDCEQDRRAEERGACLDEIHHIKEGDEMTEQERKIDMVDVRIALVMTLAAFFAGLLLAWSATMKQYRAEIIEREYAEFVTDKFGKSEFVWKEDNE